MPFQQSDDVVVGEYVDATGERRRVSPEVVAELRALVDVGEKDGPVVLRPGDRLVSPGTVSLEGGGQLDVTAALPIDVPLGYHRLADERGERPLIVSPGRCFLPAGWRAWGWGVQLYAARSRRSWGIGDLQDLAHLAERSRLLGAGFLLTNPMRATAPAVPQQPSPYSPTSRRFLNPLYLDVDEVASASTAPEVDDLRTTARALNCERRIDRDRVFASKMTAFERIFDSEPVNHDFLHWYTSHDDVRQFAAWCVLVERFGADWRTWPAAFRRPDAAGVDEVSSTDDRRARFHGWLQWWAGRQLDRVTAATRLVQDLPIGFDPGGMDAWLWQDLLAPGVSVGAPPDEFNAAGQDWGLPAFVPGLLRAAGYEPFIDTIRSSLVEGGGLRIDHVMGLFRLWWIPSDRSPSDGAYVRFPVDDLLDIVALESHRHRAVVVGEDLGTVEPGVRERLIARNMLSYRLLWFEEDDPATWPTEAMAAITTHDLPTVRGLWEGSDLATLRSLDMAVNEPSTKQIRDRLADLTAAAPGAPAEAVVIDAYDVLARAPARMLCATLDDLALVAERPNIPGAPADHPNWSLALPEPIEVVMDGPITARVARRLTAAVGGGAEEAASA